ncbi:MAG: hypothetical protein ACP5SH_21355 [Syntrophobacteraceae bacterium]
MADYIAHINAGVLAMVLAAMMVAAWGIGWLVGRRQRSRAGGEPSFTRDEAILALLGLLLAFTFAMSLGKHDQRRIAAVSDSNAIGDFYTCASLLEEPVRSQLRGLIREYAVLRYDLAERPPGRKALEKALGRIQAMQDRLTELVAQAIKAGTPIAVPLTDTLNEVTSTNASRLAAIGDRLPVTILVLLFVTALVCSILIGRQDGAKGRVQVAATLSFIILVSFVVYVTLDLNQPYHGFIKVSQDTLRRLIASMGH